MRLNGGAEWSSEGDDRPDAERKSQYNDAQPNPENCVWPTGGEEKPWIPSEDPCDGYAQENCSEVKVAGAAVITGAAFALNAVSDDQQYLERNPYDRDGY